MLQPGDWDYRVTFSQRGTMPPDDYGNVEEGFVDQFTVWAKLLPLRGGEQVMAARLEGRQPWIITVRRTPETRQITTDWRVVNVDDATQVFNVRSVTPNMTDRDIIDLLVEEGVAV